MAEAALEATLQKVDNPKSKLEHASKKPPKTKLATHDPAVKAAKEAAAKCTVEPCPPREGQKSELTRVDVAYKRWRARIWLSKSVSCTLGYFDSEQAAADALEQVKVEAKTVKEEEGIGTRGPA